MDLGRETREKVCEWGGEVGGKGRVGRTAKVGRVFEVKLCGSEGWRGLRESRKRKVGERCRGGAGEGGCMGWRIGKE